MENNAFDRGHQDKISRLKEKIAVILDNLILQSRIVTDPRLFSQSMETRSSPIFIRQTPAKNYEIAPISFYSHASSHAGNSSVGRSQNSRIPTDAGSCLRTGSLGTFSSFFYDHDKTLTKFSIHRIFEESTTTETAKKRLSMHLRSPQPYFYLSAQWPVSSG